MIHAVCNIRKIKQDKVTGGPGRGGAPDWEVIRMSTLLSGHKSRYQTVLGAVCITPVHHFVLSTFLIVKKKWRSRIHIYNRARRAHRMADMASIYDWASIIETMWYINSYKDPGDTPARFTRPSVCASRISQLRPSASNWLLPIYFSLTLCFITTNSQQTKSRIGARFKAGFGTTAILFPKEVWKFQIADNTLTHVKNEKKVSS